MIVLTYDVKNAKQELENRTRIFDKMSEVKQFIVQANNNPIEILIGKPIIMESEYEY